MLGEMQTRPWPAGLLILSLAVAAGGCKSIKETYAETFLTGEILTYEQYRAVGEYPAPRPTARDVLDSLGEPADVDYDDDGRIRKIVYHAFSLLDQLKRAEFHFDGDGVLTKKDLWLW